MCALCVCLCFFQTKCTVLPPGSAVSMLRSLFQDVHVQVRLDTVLYLNIHLRKSVIVRASCVSDEYNWIWVLSNCTKYYCLVYLWGTKTTDQEKTIHELAYKSSAALGQIIKMDNSRVCHWLNASNCLMNPHICKHTPMRVWWCCFCFLHVFSSTSSFIKHALLVNLTHLNCC